MSDQELVAAEIEHGAVSKARKQLAIPFVGKDVPSPAAEFAQPDVTIGLTIFAYELQAMRGHDVNQTLAHLQRSMVKQSGPVNERPATRMYNSWMKDAGAEVCGVADTSGALTTSASDAAFP